MSGYTCVLLTNHQKVIFISDKYFFLYLFFYIKLPNLSECCAIDYIIHTLDGTAALLNSDKYFPSRVSISEPSLKYFQSIARRLYRVFSHAYFHHRELFDQV